MLTPYGRLDVICGPMFAGKSTELLKRILWARNGENRRILVLKPAFDTRYAESRIVSHSGLASEALPVRRWPGVPDGIEAVFIDEIQFFEAPHYDGDLVADVSALLARGIHVTGAGLDADWRAQPFPVTARLLAMADTVTKITANCTVCGQSAAKTFKKIANDHQVELGQTNLYEARCNRHWHMQGLSLVARTDAAD